jgi:hypothetical protein
VGQSGGGEDIKLITDLYLKVVVASYNLKNIMSGKK